jgi:hypothetical protein
LKQAEEHYGDKLRVEYWHYPLSFHKFAETSAIASVAAQRQDKFWEYVDKLYGDMKNQSQDVLEKHATDLGMDVAKFKADLKDPELLRYVRMNTKAGEKVGVKGTPSMFLNGRKMSGRDFEGFKKEIDAELAEVDTLVAGGKSVVEARRMRTSTADNGANFASFVLDRKPIEVDLSPPEPPAAPKPEPVDTTVNQAVTFDFDPVKGPSDALVTIVECTDFQ